MDTVAEEPVAQKQRTATRGLLSLLDQAFVSGPRFVTTILVGRFCLDEELGLYQLGFSLLVFATAVQESLITSPYTVFREFRPAAERKLYAGSILAHSLVLWLASCVLFVVAALLFQRGLQPAELAPLLAILAIAVPLALSRELARRMALSELQVIEAVCVDGGVAILQLGILAALAAMDRLSPVTAMVAIAVACGVVVSAWAVYRAKSFAFTASLARQEWRNSWVFGRWVSAAQVAGVAQIHGMYWIVLFMLDKSSTGLMAACALPAMFANPFVMGINNVLTPMASRAASQGSFSQVRRLIGTSMAIVAAAMLLFCLGLWLFGDPLMNLLFRKEAYLNQNTLVLLLGINAAFVSVKMINDSGFWATQRPHYVFRACALGTIISITSSLWLIPKSGVPGAAIALIAGSVAGTIYQTTIFFGKQGWHVTNQEDTSPSQEIVS